MQEKKPVAQSIRALDVSESVSFPLDRVRYIRNAITTVSLLSDMRFETRTNKVESIITVTRIK